MTDWEEVRQSIEERGSNFTLHILASTSEIHSNVGRTWNGQNLPAENGKDRSCERNEMGVKSEYGFGSEESGYSSLKTDDDSLVNLARNESERRQEQRNRSYSPEPQPRVS